MSKKLTYLALVALFVAMCHVAQAGQQKWNSLVQAANPIHWYGFNEVEGTADAEDKGSGELNGTYRSLVDLGQEGLFGDGEAVLFERGGQDDVMWTQGGELTSPEWTAEYIVKKLSHEVGALSDSSGYSVRIVGWGVDNELSFTEYGVIDARFDVVGGADLVAPIDEWIHVAYRKTASEVAVFLNGVLVGTTSTTIDCPIESFGGRATGASDGMDGFMDEAVIYDYALTDVDILAHGQAPFLPDAGAIVLQPKNGDTDVLRDSMLSWISGVYAQTHNLYFGTVFEDVNSAAVPTATLDVNSFDPGRFEFDKTYFWRVDEVNGTPDKTVYKGDVWSFTAEPYSIPIAGSEIMATASSSSNEFSIPERTLDGSGLGENETHGIEAETMWFTAMGDMAPWIQYEFDGLKKLDTMKVWNSNSTAEGFIGYGVKDVLIEYSKDGQTWDTLEDANEFSRAPGLPTYDQYDEVTFGGVAAKMVRLSIQSNFGGFMQAYSLSEVQFYMIPAAARTPMPVSGSVDIFPGDVLSWRAGREAAQSTVYVSTDPNEVADGIAPSVTSNTNSINLGAFDIQMGETYHWRVDEVNEAEADSVWAGPVWSFATVAAVVVEDFENYTNDSPNRPFQTWLDGYGYSADEFFAAGYGGNGTGAGIGHDIWTVSSPHYNGNIMETANTMPGSNQAMPFYYSNSGSVASQTERTFAPVQDWTVGGAQTLSIAFRGQTGNTGTLFVKINNTKLTYPHAASNIALGVWQAWNIDLASITVQNVTTLQIGVDGNGASGMLLIDDIKLHAEAGELITPADPGTDGLIAKFAFDGDTSDSSGHGHNGTVVGTDGTTFVNDPVRGQVLSLPGGDDQYVEVGAVGISGTMPRTIACWAKAANTEIPDYTLIFGFTGQADGSGGNGSHFNLGSLGGPGGVGAHCWGWEETMVSDEDALEWHHYAMTYDGTTIVYFADGVQMDSDLAKSNVRDLSISADRVHIGSRITSVFSFPGHVDDAVIYNRVLSAGEVLSLAGISVPIDKPF